MDTFTIRGLSFSYPEQVRRTLDGVNLTVREGEFLVLCGPSGCGKSTLLRQLKTVLIPHGRCKGEILFEGAPLGTLDVRTQSEKIGYVLQNPETQIVTDKVWHELAFGLESLGLDTPVIRRRVAEMASFFGIEPWFYKNTAELSGGQKQLLNLASIMVMYPSVLILDEPTSQLDPIAASDFLASLGKINRELGTTVILTEHRLEEAFPLGTHVAVMDSGRIFCEGNPSEVGGYLRERGHTMFLAMPSAMRIWSAVPNMHPCPITVKEGREWLKQLTVNRSPSAVGNENIRKSGEIALELNDVWFKYEKGASDILKGLSLRAFEGEFLAVLGGNGTGKTTMLGIISGLRRAYRGSVTRLRSVGMLPQNPQTVFVKKTVREDVCEMLKRELLLKGEREKKVARVIQLCRLQELLDQHPYDLSGGEQQRVALAKVLLLAPEILLLDEPTKGLDAEFKQVFAGILGVLLRRGVTVVMVSHDVEFCAKYAHRCAMFFDGNIVAEGTPREFFSGNSFYTTSANRIARGIVHEAVTSEDVIAALGGDIPQETEFPDDNAPIPPPDEDGIGVKPKKLPLWRKILAGISGIVAAGTFIMVMCFSDLSEMIMNDALTDPGYDQFPILAVFIAALFATILAIGRKSCLPIDIFQKPHGDRKLPKRTVAATAMILLVIPLTVFIGSYYLGDRKYYFILLLVVLESMLPFVLIFEGRKPQARELVIIAVLCAIGVAGRAAFFMLPNFKPVMALVIITGIAFGGETGFLVGAVTMLVSNMMFGQGPLAPFQMFSMGMIGFLAGVLFRKGLLIRSPGAMSMFGALAAVILYGGIMDAASALIWTGSLKWGVLLTYYISGVPFNLIHAAGTVFFILTAAEPMLEKLDRIKVKYGLVEQ